MTSVRDQAQNYGSGLAPDGVKRLFYGIGNGAGRDNDLGHDDLLWLPRKFDWGLRHIKIESQAATADVLDSPKTGTENLGCGHGFYHTHYRRLPGYLQVAAEYRQRPESRPFHNYHRYPQPKPLFFNAEIKARDGSIMPVGVA